MNIKASRSSKCNRCSYLSPKYSLLYLSAAVSIFLNDARDPCFVSAMATPPTPTSASIMRRAIELSTKANADPSFGEEACMLWKSVLYSKESSFPLAAMSVAHGLHACTLARIGEDNEAIVEYTTALELMEESGAFSGPMTKDEMSLREGMGRSLQRLFRYDEAADAFLKVAARCAEIDVTTNGQRTTERSWKQNSHSNSVRSAALCCMRNGDLISALSTIEKYEGIDAELDGMNGALLLLKSCSSAVRMEAAERHESSKKAMKLLFTASANSSPLYKWMYLASHIEKRDRIEPLDSKADGAVLALAGINNSAFDDPDLINLDDKVRLHSILMDTSSGFSFWPQGFILPVEYDSFQSELYNNGGDDVDPGQLKWILKERNGYGSHGNMLASTDKVLSMYDSGEFDEPILCQRIVDPPLLIDGRKFSLRIYAVYFPRGILPGNVNELFDAGVFISTEGLVKYAAATYDGALTPEFSDDQYMTNSGRGDGRSALQHNLIHLQNEFQRSGIKYRKVWESIEQSVQIVMARYLQLQRDDTPSLLSSGQSFIRNSHLPFCCIPKILGFDYILDSSAKPYLLEVNRFPGLEPRSSMDSLVKQTVVYDAWVMASDRTGLPDTFFRNFRPPNHKGSSLKQLI